MAKRRNAAKSADKCNPCFIRGFCFSDLFGGLQEKLEGRIVEGLDDANIASRTNSKMKYFYYLQPHISQ
jgi:hypothetical protein